MRVVVLGNGLLGGEIARQSQWHTVSRKQNNFDINKPSQYGKHLDKAAIIINCIANTDTYKAGDHYLTNYKSVLDLADYCIKTN